MDEQQQQQLKAQVADLVKTTNNLYQIVYTFVMMEREVAIRRARMAEKFMLEEGLLKTPTLPPTAKEKRTAVNKRNK